MKVLKRIGTVVISVLLWVIILVAALYAFTTMAPEIIRMWPIFLAIRLWLYSPTLCHLLLIPGT